MTINKEEMQGLLSNLRMDGKGRLYSQTPTIAMFILNEVRRVGTFGVVFF